MSETLQQFIVRRRGELDAEASRLKLDLLVVEAEREKVDKVAEMFASEPESKPTIAMNGDALARWAAKRPVDRSTKRMSESTIKEMVVDILNLEWAPMTALDILAKINERTGIDYPRTSLSPQLSRLKADGKIHREGRLWALGDGPDIGHDAEQTEDEGPQTDEPPAEAEAS